ncbi:hypothetical protein VNO77_18637 [Canavalia gladiata]|uniref:AP2/ERF domain-containing protein n=1 Tax=Canavalia gladiata TaxID=3824 RepID=A0AAN9LL51_CANGL
MRVHSGGHDYEGLSFVSLIEKSLMIFDLVKLCEVNDDIAHNTIWIQTRATVGEVYYKKLDGSNLCFILLAIILIQGKSTSKAYFKAKSGLSRASLLCPLVGEDKSITKIREYQKDMQRLKIRDSLKKGARVWLWTFEIADQVTLAYDKATLRIRGSKACLNFLYDIVSHASGVEQKGID